MSSVNDSLQAARNSLDAVLPVLGGRELVPDDHGDAGGHAAGQADHAAHRVVERERTVEDVRTPHSYDGGQTSRGQDIPSVFDYCSFGHP